MTIPSKTCSIEVRTMKLWLKQSRWCFKSFSRKIYFGDDCTNEKFVLNIEININRTIEKSWASAHIQANFSYF